MFGKRDVLFYLYIVKNSFLLKLHICCIFSYYRKQTLGTINIVMIHFYEISPNVCPLMFVMLDKL